MSRAAHPALRRAAVAVGAAGVALALLGVAGCRDGGSAALPAPPASTRSLPPADPLAGVESVLDDLEGDLDAGAGPAPAR